MNGHSAAIALPWRERAAWNDVGAARARRLIDALCDVALPAWRAAALAAAADTAVAGADAALDRVLLTRDRVQLWALEDDLATAMHRLTGDGACLLFRTAAERKAVCAATRRAVLAIACADALASADLDRLTRPFLALA